MADYKTPGVYVEEISTLPPSAGQVPTAIPAFIGYTQRAEKKGKNLNNTPAFISSLLEYKAYFGLGYDPQTIDVQLKEDTSVDSIQFDKKFYMYDSVRMFFANGGGQCYIVSVGNYNDEIDAEALLAGIDACQREDIITMLVSPDSVLVGKKDECYSLQQAMLMQCNKLQDRVTVLDIYDGYIDRSDDDVVLNFRNGIGVNFLKYGAAYYPWIQTTFKTNFSFKNIVLKNQDGEEVQLESLVDDPSLITQLNEVIADVKTLDGFIANPFEEDVTLSEKFLKVPDEIKATRDELAHTASILNDFAKRLLQLRDSDKITNTSVLNEFRSKTNSSSVFSNTVRSLTAFDKALELGLINPETDYTDYELGKVAAMPGFENLEEKMLINKAQKALKAIFEGFVEVMKSLKNDTLAVEDHFDKMVFDTNPLYQNIVNEVSKEAAKLPVAGAIAGVYAQVDANRGVWKAPANVSLNSCVRPWVKINNDQQEDLNVDLTGGKSVNVVRAFVGQGNLVWGARTLAGNDNEWRYISVRRFFNMVEKSLKLATNWAVFEPNDEITWLKVKAMIDNFLTNLWQAGALVGSSPGEAFFVNVGLGSTMTQVDVLEGRMNVEIGMAVVRPAEFIVLKFSHKFDMS